MYFPTDSGLKVLEKLALPVLVLFVIGALWLIGQVIWYFVSGPAPLPIQSNEVETDTSRSLSPDLKTIQDSGIFDHTQVVEPQNTVQETTLRLVLIGVFVAEDPDQSTALIKSDRSREPEIYGVGDTIEGVAKLVEIHDDRVLFSRSGNQEQLAFASENVGFVSQSNAVIEVTRATDDTPVNQESPLERVQATFRNEYHGLSPTLNPTAIGALRQIGLKLNSSDEGAFLELDENIRNAVVQRVGLLPADRVISVNGVRIADLAGRRAFEIFGNTNEVDLEIQRNSRTFVISVDPTR